MEFVRGGFCGTILLKFHRRGGKESSCEEGYVGEGYL